MSKTFDDPDLPATAEELAEAEALSQALEKGNADTSSELETAALLRQAHGVEIPDVLDRVLPGLAARRRRRWWLWPAVLVPAAAGLLMMAGGLSYRRFAVSSPGAESLLPPRTPWPSAGLLAAQSHAASGDRTALAALEAEMRLYRADAYRERKRR
jgi:hypothetical protein